MFFIDEPYVSDFFKKTVKNAQIPVVETAVASRMGLCPGSKLVTEAQAIEMAMAGEPSGVYTTSENSIGWFAKHLAFSDLSGKIELFKDKLKFRQLLKPIFPDFYFQELRFQDLATFSIDDAPIPFIIKPTVGFFSMGVHKVSNRDEWPRTVASITAEIKKVEDLYPKEVMNAKSFIIEQCIEGEEFAVDAYYNSAGTPVVLGIFKHTFSSDADVSDRVYSTSKAIIERNLDDITEFLGTIGSLTGVRNFPMHVELRREQDGVLQPIEVNPLRFGGWCTTADMTALAYDFNPYLYYYSQLKPNWPELLKGKEGKLFNIIVLDNSTGLAAAEIEAFDYEKLLAKFSKPLELRRIDYREYPVFGFLFAETPEDDFSELAYILDSDLNEFVATLVPVYPHQ
jgi:hypothetical protein